MKSQGEIFVTKLATVSYKCYSFMGVEFGEYKKSDTMFSLHDNGLYFRKIFFISGLPVSAFLMIKSYKHHTPKSTMQTYMERTLNAV